MKRRQTCDHIGIFTTDAKRLVSFYKNKLGFKEERKRTVLPRSLMKIIFGVSSECEFIRLVPAPVKKGEKPGLMIEIFEPALKRLKKNSGSAAGLNHWGYSVGDRERYCRKLKKKKVKIIEVKRGDHRTYFIKDPDGNRIEIRD
ncbi:MAG: VOC family protein [Candidatus Omnitrophota bacterium]